ncbi:MAG: ABC transporter permease [Bacteroidetes bacterium]|nr:ABC transporter permease [Bacteroidota bacterium]
MRRFFFLLREAFSGLGRARLSASFSIIMVTLSFTLLGSFYLTTVQAEKFLNYLKSKVEIEAFLSDSLSVQQIQDVGQKLLATRGVSNVQYVSKEEAAEIFKKEFGQDISQVLDFNPLPASYRIFVGNRYKTSRDVAAIASKVKAVPGIESVKYRKILLSLIDRRVRLFYGVMVGFGGALVLLSIFLVYNSMRLAISYKKRIIDAMKLVGASRSFVRMPFLLGGMIQGFTGGLIASAAIYGIIHAALVLMQENILIEVLPLPEFYAAIVVIATLLGLFSTLFATRRYIKEGLS